jgi:hypothetical protein
LQASYDELSAAEQPLSSDNRRQWEALNLRFHETLLSGYASPWTLKVLRLLARHSERYRCYAMEQPALTRDVHAEHQEIFELAMAGQEARAALALEAHICTTPICCCKPCAKASWCCLAPGRKRRYELQHSFIILIAVCAGWESARG